MSWLGEDIVKKNWLTKKEKFMIAFLCRNTDKSFSQIGDFLGFHKNTISKYKEFNEIVRLKD